MKRKILFFVVSLLLPLAACADDYFEFWKGNDGIRYRCYYKGPKKGIAYVCSFDRDYEEIIVPTQIYAYNDYEFETPMYENTYEVHLLSAYTYSGDANGRNIKKLTLPSKFKRIPQYFCSGMINLEEFKCGEITFIGSGAFRNCVSLKTFNIPNSVDTICSIAFENCVNLKSINLTEYLSGGQFYRINVIPNSVKFIGGGAFRNCQSLKAIRLSNNLTSIESSLFANCPYLEKVEFQHVDSIGERAFEGCVNLPSITIPNGCKSIGVAAFCFCTNLEELTIPNSVTYIGDYAFQYCVGFKNINVSWNNPITTSRNIFENSGTWWWTTPKTYSNMYYYGWPKELIDSVSTVIGQYERDHIYNSAQLNILGASHLPYKETAPWSEFQCLYDEVDVPVETILLNTNSCTIWDNNSYRLTATVLPSNATRQNVTWSSSNTNVATVTAAGQVLAKNRGKATITCTAADGSGVTATCEVIVNSSADAVTIRAQNYGRYYGSSNPNFTYYTVEGTINSGEPTLTCSADKTSPVGTYDIVIKRGTISNDSVKCVNGTLTVMKASLTISVGDYTKVEGEENPIFTPIFNGFKNGENNSVLIKQPTISCSATKDSPAGTYIITVSGAEADNYNTTYKSGTLTIISKSSLEINETNFPDAVFREYVSGSTIDKDQNGKLSDEEISAVKTIDVNNLEISDLSGIEFFTALTTLNCRFTKITSIDLSRNTALKNLDCRNNTLTALNVANNTALTALRCSRNKITSLDVSKNTELTVLRCNYNQLTALDVSQNTKLEQLDCFGNKIGKTAMGNLIASLPNVTSGKLYVIDTTWSAEENVCTTEQVATAKAKGWTVYDNNSTNPIEYAGSSEEEIITFADANVKAICVANWDTNGDGELSKAEAAAVTDLGEVFFKNHKITTFNELQYFTGLTSIGDNAFTLCDCLTSVTIPHSVTSIGDNVFFYCIALTSIVVENGNTVYDSRNNCNAIIKTSTNTLIVGCKNTIIPNSVTIIANDAFQYCIGMASITIPNSVTSIGDNAFYGCTGLTSINIPNSVTSIGSSAFSNCSSLTSIVVGSGNTVYDSRNNCNAIIKTSTNTLIVGCKNTIIPNSVTSIGSSAFSGCSGLTSVTIPNSVTSIGSSAFSGCSGLTSVTIPNSVTSIGYGTFSGCSGLTSVTIPNSVTSIGIYAFQYCSALTSVTIPNSVTSIGSHAFYYCSALTSIISEIQDPFIIAVTVFSGTSENAVLMVPAGTKSKYEATNFWNKFTNIVEMDLTPVDDGETVDFGNDIDDDTNLNGNVVGDVLYNISSDGGGYSDVEGCIVVTKPTADTAIDGQDIFGEDFKDNYNGIVFKVPAGKGSVKVEAQTTGSMMLKVKIGNNDPVEMALQGKLKVTFPYNVTEATYVYIYGGSGSSNAPGMLGAPSATGGELKLYGIEVDADATGISLTPDPSPKGEGKWYSLDGQLLQGKPTQKGVYIVNGRKVVMK